MHSYNLKIVNTNGIIANHIEELELDETEYCKEIGKRKATKVFMNGINENVEKINLAIEESRKIFTEYEDTEFFNYRLIKADNYSCEFPYVHLQNDEFKMLATEIVLLLKKEYTKPFRIFKELRFIGIKRCNCSDFNPKKDYNLIVEIYLQWDFYDLET